MSEFEVAVDTAVSRTSVGMLIAVDIIEGSLAVLNLKTATELVARVCMSSM